MRLRKVLFSVRGRINRRAYWGVYLSLLFFGWIANAWFDGINHENSGEFFLGLSVLILFFIFITYIAIATAIKRCHDIGWSGWMVLAILLPVVSSQIIQSIADFIYIALLMAQTALVLSIAGLIVILYLGFAKGNPIENKYGGAPGSRKQNIR